MMRIDLLVIVQSTLTNVYMYIIIGIEVGVLAKSVVLLP